MWWWPLSLNRRGSRELRRKRPRRTAWRSPRRTGGWVRRGICKPPQGVWDLRGSGVGWVSLGVNSLIGFSLMGWGGESLVLFRVPSSTSAHSAGVEDTEAHCLLALGKSPHWEQDSNKIDCDVCYMDMFAAQLYLVRKKKSRCKHKKRSQEWTKSLNG